jgi:RimJ/RimL family protein N-acetyltransferase
MARSRIVPLGLDEARRILTLAPGPDDHWAPGYPFADELDVLPLFIAAFEQHGDPAPFGLYAIVRASDDRYVGGIGFFGPPENGVAELGFGLIEGARGNGLAAEALSSAIRIALDNGATSVVADALLDNAASHRTMLTAGMVETRRDERLVYFATR